MHLTQNSIAELVSEETAQIMVDWPGWPLSHNKYGDEFDREARIRMVVGGRRLLPHLSRHRQHLGDSILEIGPFFNPLLKYKILREAHIEGSSFSFLENDPMATKWLKENFECRILDLDMNSPSFTNDLDLQLLSTAGDYSSTFSTIILSQVLNYVDHHHLLKCLRRLIRPGGLLFINNIVNYGIPVLFSRKRPRSNKDIITAAEASGYRVIEKSFIPKQHEKEPQRRMILVLSPVA